MHYSIFSRILVLAFSLLALSFGSRATVQTPQASVDLICHSDQASECYPRIFQPTESFQIVHDDQHLPPGLHVRLDITTGKKEAKINIIEVDDQALVTTAVDVAVVDSEPESPPGDLASSHEHVQEPPKFNKQGAIRPPPSNNPEGDIFESIKAYVRTVPPDKPKVLLSTLETLEDLSHDIYYGLKLAEDSEVVLKLLDLVKSTRMEANIKGAALLVLGTAIQNNPAALTAALSHFYNDETPTGPMEAILVALVHEQLPQLLTRHIYLLSALCQDPAQLWKFINANGLDILITIFDAEKAGSDEKDRLRGKIANFILDHFLQQDSFKPQENRTEQAFDTEVASQSDSEDPWVLNTAYAENYEWPVQTNVKPGYRNMAHLLQPWCSAFASSIKASNDQEMLGNTVETSEQHEALDALTIKLKRMGCGCGRNCDFAIPISKTEL